MSRKAFRVLLDANVWRLLADEPTAPARLESVARKRDLHILVAPSVVYEALRTGDASLRDRLVRVLTRPHWHPVMPEAFSECEELLGELRRTRPQWARSGSAEWRERNRLDWLPSTKRGFWARLRTDPARVAGHIASLEGGTIDRARKEALARRKAADSARWKYHGVDLAQVRGRFLEPIPGWNDDDVDGWRLPCLSWATVAVGDPPYSDWLEPYFPLAELRWGSDWVQFWLYDVEATRMPRWWMRSACELLQALRKVTPGTPCDAQLATYVTECDIFVSHDHAPVEILERCRSAAPFSLGSSDCSFIKRTGALSIRSVGTRSPT